MPPESRFILKAHSTFTSRFRRQCIPSGCMAKTRSIRIFPLFAPCRPDSSSPRRPCFFVNPTTISFLLLSVERGDRVRNSGEGGVSASSSGRQEGKTTRHRRGFRTVAGGKRRSVGAVAGAFNDRLQGLLALKKGFGQCAADRADIRWLVFTGVTAN